MIFSLKLRIIFLPHRKKDVSLHREMERFLTKYRVVAVAVILTLFGVAFGVESLGNHLLFRTYGLDLGIYAQTARDFAHLEVNDGTFYHWEPFNQLGDHFDLLLAILAPLAWLVRADWMLLVVQILAVLSGALGLYMLTRDICRREFPSLAAMLLMLCQFGVWHALGFDYHSNVVAACQLPWLILCVRRGRFGAATVVLVLMALAKETVALWLCFVLLALLIEHRRERRQRRWLAIATIGCMAYFAIIALVAMPALGRGSGSGFWRYTWMGATMGEVAQWILSHPLEALRDLFVDFTPAADSGQIKVEFFICALLSGMALTCLKPNYLLMLVPPLTMKMLGAAPNEFWGVNLHYNIEICMVCCCASVLVLSRIRQPRWQAVAFAAAVLLTLMTTLYTIDQPLTPIRRDNVNILQRGHYRQPEFDTRTVRRALKMIPPDASVCVTTMFSPHIACRDSAYLFPIGLNHNAEYFLILPDHWSYYEGEAETATRIIADTSRYSILLTDSTVYLLHDRRQ